MASLAKPAEALPESDRWMLAHDALNRVDDLTVVLLTWTVAMYAPRQGNRFAASTLAQGVVLNHYDPPAHCVRQRLEFFFDGIFERRMHQAQLGVHLLQPGILDLKLLDTLELARAHPAVAGLPLVVGRRADAMFSANILNLLPGLHLIQDTDDLSLGKTGLLHCSKVGVCLYFRLDQERGSLQNAATYSEGLRPLFRGSSERWPVSVGKIGR